MREAVLSLLCSVFAFFSVKGECDTCIVADWGGIGWNIDRFDQMYLTNDHTLVYIKQAGLDIPDGTYVRDYDKITKYYIPTAHNDVCRWSVSSSNRVVNGKSVGFLKRGEGISWDTELCRNGCLFYISGKDIPIEIKCPESYRQAEDIIHYIYFYGGGGDQNVLFDPIRKKQFNIVFTEEGQFNCLYSKEYDFPYFPYYGGMEKLASKLAEKKRDLRLCALAKSLLAGSELPEKIPGPVLQMFPCDYALVKQYHDIPRGRKKIDMRGAFPANTTEAEIERCIADELGLQDRYTTYTNLLVSAVRKGNEWKVSGFVAFGTNWTNYNDADKTYLLDDAGLLRMSGEFDYHSWVKVHDADGNVVADKTSSECKFEEKLDEVFKVNGEFTLERLLQRVKEDEERIRKAREK